ncbi:MAG: SatD family protein [Bacteroidota bacterium]
MNHFILMADIVQSSGKSQSKLIADFKTIVDEVNRSCEKEILSPLTITLGDEFQGIAKDLKSGINLILTMEEMILKYDRKFQLRYVLNEGEVETEINTKRAYEMLGTGLAHARKQLETAKKSSGRFTITILDHAKEFRLTKLFVLLQYFLDSWYEKDIETVNYFIAGLDYKEVAKTQGKDTSSLWRKHKSLAIEEYLVCKSLINDIVNG